MLKKLGITLAAGALSLTMFGQALAHECAVAKKPAGAGSAVTFDFGTGEITPNKPNPGNEEQIHGGFVTLAADGVVIGDTFAHAMIPSVEEGGKHYNCDGKGLDNLMVCAFGGGD